MSKELAVEIAKKCKITISEKMERIWGDDPTAGKHLNWMCDEVICHEDEWPNSKLHRWIGYIQGCLVAHKITPLDEQMELVGSLKENGFKDV